MASLPCPLNRQDNHGRVGTARMPYPPTISLKNLFFCSLVSQKNMFFCSYVLQNMYLLSNVTCLSKKHVLMFLCLTKKTCPYVLLSLNTRSHVFTTKKTVRNKYSLFRTVYLPINIQLFLFCCLSRMLLDKLLLQIVRNKLVACKLGCKRGSTACQAA